MEEISPDPKRKTISFAIVFPDIAFIARLAKIARIEEIPRKVLVMDRLNHGEHLSPPRLPLGAAGSIAVD